MAEVFLIHWDPGEAETLGAELRGRGHVVRMEAEDGARAARQVVSDLPDVLVISLRRRPSHGRQTAHYLKTQTPAREVPIVFVDGGAEDVEHVRSAVPGATFTTWDGLEDELKRS